MSSITPPVRGKSWVFQITALCIVLGMLLALSLKTQRQSVSEGIPSRWPALRAEFRDLKEQYANVQKDLAEYKDRYEKLVTEQAAGVRSAKGLKQAMEESKFLAGLSAAKGPGVVVTLHDSPKLDPAETREDLIRDYIIHDSDIRDIVNELFAAGAEAISVNSQRLVATSSIRCVGPVILVNSAQQAPPYVITAIGKPNDLEQALKLQNGVADGLFLLDMIEVKRQAEVVVPAYTGSTRFNLARPVTETQKSKSR